MTTNTMLPPPPQYWQQMTSMDLRSLALFRVALAVALAYTLIALMGAVPLWFSDAGLMPRSDSLGLGGLAAHNLTLITSQPWVLRLMLLVALVATATLLLGYRTHFSLTVATVVLFSFVTRQPLTSLPHEVWLLGIALWSLCLPLNLRWSIDATLGEPHPAAASDTRRGGLIGLAWALQWLALAGAALIQQFNDVTSPLALVGALSLVLAVTTRVLINTASAWRWTTPVLTLIGAVLILVAQDATITLIALAVLVVIPWLPSALWTTLSRRHEARAPVSIYYDGECGFCHRACRVLQDLLILPAGSTLSPAQDTARAHALMKAQNSWVVIDAQGRATLHWLAGATLVQHSAWLAPLGSVLALAPIRNLGDRLYRSVVTHRGLLAALFGKLPSASKPAGMTRLTLIALLLLATQGITTILVQGRTGTPPSGLAFTAFITTPELHPIATPDGQWFAAVERIPGQQRDMLRDDQPLKYDLTAPTGDYDDARWHRYLTALAAEPAISARRLATRLCSSREMPPPAINLEWIIAADTAATGVQRQRIERFTCVDGVAHRQRQSVDIDPSTVLPGE